jgi:hypothetical protein
MASTLLGPPHASTTPDGNSDPSSTPWIFSKLAYTPCPGGNSGLKLLSTPCCGVDAAAVLERRENGATSRSLHLSELRYRSGALFLMTSWIVSILVSGRITTLAASGFTPPESAPQVPHRYYPAPYLVPTFEAAYELVS